VIASVVDEIVGRFAAASNTTLLGRAAGRLVVYKPIAGNRPLWDFDVATLADREILTYEIARALGFDCVPETIMGEGPLGPGSVQRFVDRDEAFDPLELVTRTDDSLWPVAALDLIVNNADRKASHLIAEDGHLRAVDHGLTFHSEPKLRTVLWGLAGQRIPAEIRRAIARPRLREVIGRVAEKLGPEEAVACERRVVSLLEHPVHPEPPTDRPPLPWPPY
jgi:uncharacterized repeat protein (TIGR03843 family)